MAQLRERFVERDHADFVFKKEYHKRIPADGLPMYLETIWVCCMCHALRAA